MPSASRGYTIHDMPYIVIFMLALMLSVHTTAFAQTSTDATTSPIAATETSQPPTPEPPRSEVRSALSAVAQARLTNLAANVSNRMDAYVRRISNVTDRLESRANKMAEEGFVVDTARTKIADARRELETARTTLATIDSTVASFVGSENPRTYWKTVKSTYETARNAIKAAHRATVETLLILKSATPATPAPTATTTESTPNTLE